jgi:nucleoside-diphosphate-sugar epimerase
LKYLITGVTGFIGRFVASNMVNNDFRVILKNDMESDLEKFVYDLRSSSIDDSAFFDIDCIIHLAGLAHDHSYTSDDFQSVNVDGTLHFALEAAKAGVKRFVFVSSIVVNGTSTNQLSFSATSELNPQNAYAQSKFDAEVGLKQIAEKTGLEVVIVRPTLVYGPNAPGNFGLLTKLVRKLPFLPFGLADNKRDFISVQNLVDLLVTCANHPNAAGHTFLASDGEAVSIKEFTNAIAIGLKKSSFQLPIPIWLMRRTAHIVGRTSMVEQLLGNLQVDSSNVHEVLGWTPPYTMEQAMASLSGNTI